MTIQEAPLDTAHVQSRLVAMVSVPAAPAGGADCIELVTLTWHLAADGPLSETDEELHARASEAARKAAIALARAHELRLEELGSGNG